jgi:hypothetical protein
MGIMSKIRSFSNSNTTPTNSGNTNQASSQPSASASQNTPSLPSALHTVGVNRGRGRANTAPSDIRPSNTDTTNRGRGRGFTIETIAELPDTNKPLPEKPLPKRPTLKKQFSESSLGKRISGSSLRKRFLDNSQASSSAQPPVPALPSQFAAKNAEINPSKPLVAGTLEEFHAALALHGIGKSELQDIKDAIDGKKLYTKSPKLQERYEDQYGDRVRFINIPIEAAIKSLEKNYKTHGSLQRPRVVVGKLIEGADDGNTLVKMETFPLIKETAIFWKDFELALLSQNHTTEKIAQIRTSFLEQRINANKKTNHLSTIIDKYFLFGVSNQNIEDSPAVQMYIDQHTPDKSENRLPGTGKQVDFSERTLDESKNRLPSTEELQQLNSTLRSKLKDRCYETADSDDKKEILKIVKKEIIAEQKEKDWERIQREVLADENIPLEEMEKLHTLQVSVQTSPTDVNNIIQIFDQPENQFKSDWVLQQVAMRGANTTNKRGDDTNNNTDIPGTFVLPELTLKEAQDIKAWLSNFLQQAIDHTAQQPS